MHSRLAASTHKGSFNPGSSLVTWGLFVMPFHEGGNGDSEKAAHAGGQDLWTQVFLTRDRCFLGDLEPADNSKQMNGFLLLSLFFVKHIPPAPQELLLTRFSLHLQSRNQAPVHLLQSHTLAALEEKEV